MNNSEWEAKLKGFLKKTGEDFKKFGSDIKQEAEHLMTEVQDPKRQEKVREGLREVGVWARKTAEEVAVLVNEGVEQAGKAINRAADVVTKTGPIPAPTKSATTRPEQASVTVETPATEPAEPKPAKKTVGRGGKKTGASKPKSSKTLGKKKQG